VAFIRVRDCVTNPDCHVQVLPVERLPGGFFEISLFLCRSVMTSLADSESSRHLFLSLSLAVLPLAGVVFAVYLTYLRWLKSPFRGLPYPPGPLPKNIISGNSSDIPRSRPWHTYAEWAKIYGKQFFSHVINLLHSMAVSQGDIFHFRIYGQHTIILNSVEDVRELFEKRAGLYSDRPKNVMVNL
jgi:hypothetical protein